ncbi:MAG: glycosyltransferase family 2 protein [Lentimicrobium sp.]
MTNPQIAILIPVHNGLHFTKKCLHNIYMSLHNNVDEPGKFVVIVIDDGSTDHSKEWITENYPETLILEGDGHLWWSGGINRGIYHAVNELGCEYTLWWNNDIHCSHDYFSNLLTLTENIPVDIIIGSKIYYAEKPEIIWSMGGLFDEHSGSKFIIGMNKADANTYNVITDADWLPGMGTLIHKSLFEKIGFVNAKDFPQYHGDSDFTYRAKLAGYPIKVFPQLKIWNDKSNSGLQHFNNVRLLIRSLNDIKSNYHIGKDLLFYRKYASSPIAYTNLISKYYYYIGGFIKWKFLSLLGLSKNTKS